MKNDKTSDLKQDFPLMVSMAYRYFLKGLTAKEIGILCKISERTVSRWAKEYEFKEKVNPTPIKQKCLELSKKGLSYSQIARQLKISKSTVYNYMKESRNN